MIATIEDFVSHVSAHAGASVEQSEQATQAVLSGIGAYLDAPSRQLVSEELPPALAAALVASDGVALPIDEQLLAPGMTAGQARELIASVCRVLVEQLSTDAVDAMRRCVPAAIATLLEAPAPELSRARSDARPHTLSSGRPGSLRPVSDVRSGRAHGESVASENPHAATKLSSSTGTTQERLHDTLAEGRPGRPRS